MLYSKIDNRRIWSLVVGAALALFSLSALAAPAAYLEFVTGSVLIGNRQNQTRPAEKGMALEEGDTVMTNDGRAQVRFSDGGYFSLQPQTHFRVDEYRYSGNHDDGDHVFLSLLKGGLRTISGLVGKSNRAAYRMTTTVATIGIRGTEYVLDLNSTLYGHVAHGAIEVCNGAGCVTVPGGQAFFVSSPSTLPVFTEKRSVLAPPARPVAAIAPARLDKSPESAGQRPQVSKGGITDSVIPADFTLPATVVVQVGNPTAGQQLGVQIGAQVTQSVAQSGNQLVNQVGQVGSPVGTVVNTVATQLTSPTANGVGSVITPVGNTLGTVVGTTLTNPLANQVGSTVSTVGGSLPVLGNGLLNGILR